MKLFLKMFGLFFLTSLFIPTSVLGHTEDNKEKETTTHFTSITNQIHFSSLSEAWRSVQNSTKKIEEFINSTNLAPIHKWQEKLSIDLHYLRTNSSQIVGDQAKRLDAALKQADDIANNLHKAADKKLIDPAKREFEKLRNALKLVEVQYSKDTLQSTNSNVDHTAITEESPSLSGIIFTSRSLQGPLKVGKKAEVLMQLKKKEGHPVSLSDLKEVHTKKIHLLIIDSSLTDYHHLHPTPTTNSGEYQFSFTPKKPGSYRVWANIVSIETDQEEYLITDLLAETKNEPITDRKLSFLAEIDDLTLILSFNKDPLKSGEAALGKLKIINKKGTVFSQLEPVMGAYAHIVGFNEDYQTIAHIHPMGPEPTQASDRGVGELTFHLVPKNPGLIRLFVQIQIKGEDKFAPFTLFVPVESD